MHNTTEKYFNFAGENSMSFMCYASQNDSYTTPTVRGKTDTVTGKSGDMYRPEGTLDSVLITLKCFIPRDFKRNYRALMEHLFTHAGNHRLELGERPDGFWLARYEGGTKPNVASRGDAGSFTIDFTADPRFFFNNGDAWVSVRSGDTLSGISGLVASPVVKIPSAEKNAVLNFGDSVVTVKEAQQAETDLNNMLTIDSEHCRCFKGDTNKNSVVGIDHSKENPYPVINGNTAVTFTGLGDYILVKPNTWTIA